jgi:hypothetical protein
LEKDAVPGTVLACDYCGATITVPGTPGGDLNISEPTSRDEVVAASPPTWIAGQLGNVEQAIDAREDNLNTDKARLKEAARKIWLNALKKKDGDWDEVTREVSYLVRDAKDIFEIAAGLLTDSRSEVKDFIEPIITVARKSADARPVVETVQSFAQAMAEAQGGAAPGNLDSFTMPSAPRQPQRPVWQIALAIAGVGCCLFPIAVMACLVLSGALVAMRR